MSTAIATPKSRARIAAATAYAWMRAARACANRARAAAPDRSRTPAAGAAEGPAALKEGRGVGSPAAGAPADRAASGLRCMYDACTQSIPGSCRGTYQPVVGSKLCGGYQACAGKTCGDTCTICDPADPSCIETAVLKACDRSNACVTSTTPDCSQP